MINVLLPGLATNVFLIGLIFVVQVALVKILWGHVVPHIFPKAVREGYVRRELSYLAALGLVLLMNILF